MTREWFDIPDDKWEALTGFFPIACLDRHPSGNYVSMQIIDTNDEVITERAAIWDTKTRKIVWSPENTNALCWIERGSELLVLEKFPKKGAERPPLFVTPTQSEYQHFMRKVSWPGLETISRLELKFPMGWLIDIVSSPVAELACFVWRDQCESGIEFVSWESGELQQLPKMGFLTDSTFIQGPVFNENGTVLAMSFGAGCWWSESPDEPSAGGSFNAGYIIWTETNSGRYNRIDIEVILPAGWLPEDIEDNLHNMCLSRPIFISPNEIKISLPTKEERIISLYT